ncbi:MAG TPA: hypothetical protein PLB25_18610, partial [Rhodoferax sp.]|nr:hypothetical protein [Rhodoferax sp.]
NVMLLERTGQYHLAASEIKALFRDDVVDYDLVYAGYLVGARTHDWALMIQALELRIDRWPREAVDGWLKLGEIYSQKMEVKDHNKALIAYRTALFATPESAKEATLSKIPQDYRLKLSGVGE